MRTTLNIDDDVLRAAKEIARHQRRSAGEVVSELLRRALTMVTTGDETDGVMGFRPFPPTGRVVTNSVVDALRDDGPY